MGNKSGKSPPPPEGHIVDVMTNKYSPNAVKFLNDWSHKHGFPNGGSFSQSELRRLREKLEKEKDELKKKKRVKTSAWREADEQRECLEMWEREAEARARKQLQGQMVKMSVNEDKNVNKKEKSKLYPCLSGHKGPLLDSCPPLPPQPTPPPYQPATTQQTTASPTAPPAVSSPDVSPAAQLPSALKLDEPEGALGGRAGQTADSTTGWSPTNPFGKGPEVQFSPIRTRSYVTGESLQQHPIFQAPMVQVAGAAGPMVVFRPWTEADMKEAMKHLPDHKASGERFGEEFGVFCADFHPTMPEIRRLLLIKLGPTDYAKVKHACEGNERLNTVEYEHHDNAAYRQKLTNIKNALKAAFPIRVDMSRISSCTQRDGESVEDYYHRLLHTFSDNSGIPEPSQRGEAPGAWETHMRHCLVAGLLPPIKRAVEISCIGLQTARLAEVKRHAEHAESRLRQKTEKEGDRRRKLQDEAQLTMLQAVSSVVQAPGRGRGHRGRARGRGGPGRGGFGRVRDHTGWTTGCFICGKDGHWARDCPDNPENTTTRPNQPSSD